MGDIRIRLRNIDYYLQGVLSLEKFLDEKRGSDGKFSVSWPELRFLRNTDIDRLGDLLIKLPEGPRRLVIMREEVCGFNKVQLRRYFGLNNDDLTLFTKVTFDNESISLPEWGDIRYIIPQKSLSKEFWAFISLLARVPLEWLQTDCPVKSWSTTNIKLLKDLTMSEFELLTFIQSEVKFDRHDVRGVTLLTTELETPLYLRLEIEYGTIIIELCNESLEITQYRVFEKLFRNMVDVIYGYLPTVINGQINPTVVLRHPNSVRPICYPIGFDPRSSLL